MFCGENEFYDGVVGMCSKCSDVCVVANDFCSINCPGYTGGVMNSAGSRHGVPVSMTSFPSRKSPSGATVSTVSDTLTLLMRRPLFWTSVISLFVSVLATSVLVMLCVCRRRRLAMRRSLVYSTARSLHSFRSADHCNEKPLSECKLAVGKLYSDNREMLSVREQESSAIPDSGTRVSLSTVDNLHIDRQSSSVSNISQLTDSPHFRPVSWIVSEHSLSSCGDADDMLPIGDDVTDDSVDQVSQVFSGNVGLVEHVECNETDESQCSLQAEVTDYSTSLCGSDCSLTDSGTSSMYPDPESVSMSSQLEDRIASKSERLECGVVVYCGNLDRPCCVAATTTMIRI